MPAFSFSSLLQNRWRCSDDADPMALSLVQLWRPPLPERAAGAREREKFKIFARLYLKVNTEFLKDVVSVSIRLDEKICGYVVNGGIKGGYGAEVQVEV
jgi:hypothetical protein